MTSDLHLAPSRDWWSYTSTPPYVFMAWCLINKAQGLYLRYVLHFMLIELDLECHNTFCEVYL
jgi:hypothetical protein